jgi:hypothetical protein
MVSGKKKRCNSDEPENERNKESNETPVTGSSASDDDDDDDGSVVSSSNIDSSGREDNNSNGGDQIQPHHSKVQARREANRLHAFKSRQRTKNLLVELQQTVTKISQEKSELERKNAALTAQVDILQQQYLTLLQNLQQQQQIPQHVVGNAANMIPCLPGSGAVPLQQLPLQQHLLALQQQQQQSLPQQSQPIGLQQHQQQLQQHQQQAAMQAVVLASMMGAANANSSNNGSSLGMYANTMLGPPGFGSSFSSTMETNPGAVQPRSLSTPSCGEISVSASGIDKN